MSFICEWSGYFLLTCFTLIRFWYRWHSIIWYQIQLLFYVVTILFSVNAVDLFGVIHIPTNTSWHILVWYCGLIEVLHVWSDFFDSRYTMLQKKKKKRICHVVVINSSISVPSSFYISSFITRKKLVSLDKLLDIGTINGILEYKCPLVLLTWGKNREPKVMIGS